LLPSENRSDQRAYKTPKTQEMPVTIRHLASIVLALAMRASRVRKARVSFDAINEVDVAVGEVDMTGKDEIELV
jgi:hypothetical protein